MTRKEKQKGLILKAVADSFTGGKLSDKKLQQYLNIFKKLPRTEALIYLKTYLEEIRKFKENNTLQIESSIKLEKDQIKSLEDYLKQEYTFFGTKVNLNPSLLGGIRIKIGDVLIDDSVAARISELGRSISR